jgi:hypothetical protein
MVESVIWGWCVRVRVHVRVSMSVHACMCVCVRLCARVCVCTRMCGLGVGAWVEVGCVSVCMSGWVGRMGA